MRSPGYLDLKKKGRSLELEQRAKTWIGMEEATIDSETIDLEADNGGFAGERLEKGVSRALVPSSPGKRISFCSSYYF